MFNIADVFSTIESLTVDEVRNMLDEKGGDETVLVDVREPAEYKDGHIPGSMLLPLSRILDDLHSLPLTKTLVVYCKRGIRSRSATALLKRSGFKKVYNMKGGMNAWNGLVSAGDYETGSSLLEGKSTPEELVSLAIALEEGAKLFYEKAKEYVGDEDTNNIFDKLISAEVKHKGLLMKSAAGPERKRADRSTTEESSAHLIESGVPLNDIIDWMQKEKRSVQDILELAMQIETNSLDLYMKMLQKIKDEKTRAAIIALIKEEKAHLAMLGELLGRKIDE